MMSEERSFLKAIGARPEDRTARLVYADWLDERDDERGELTRIEEEIRTIPIHSDRYWELKPRRRTLLKSVERAWLKQMGYGGYWELKPPPRRERDSHEWAWLKQMGDSGMDYQPVFADIPTGWKERWRLIREFTERWYQIPMDDVGGPLKPFRNRRGSAFEEEETQTIDEAMNDSKVSAGLPPSLREWVFFVRDLKLGLKDFDSGSGNRHYFGDYQDDGKQRIYFLEQDGGRDGYFVRDEDRHEPDPPVWWDWFSLGIPRNSSRLVAPHVTTLALNYLLTQYEPAFGDGPNPQKMTKKFARRLAKSFPVHSHFDETQIFERPNVIVLWLPGPAFIGDQPCLHVKVRPPANRDEVFAQLFD